MSVNPVAETASASVGQCRPDAADGDAWADADAPAAVPVACEADDGGADDSATALDDAAPDDAEAADDPPPLA
jgi:hypothetical protein